MDEDPLETKRRQARERMRRYRERLSQDSKKRYDEQHLQPQPSTSCQSASATSHARKTPTETTHEGQARLSSISHVRKRQRIQETTPERESRLAVDAESQRRRRAQETTPKRESRLAVDAESQRRRRAQESTTKRESRLAVHS